MLYCKQPVTTVSPKMITKSSKSVIMVKAVEQSEAGRTESNLFPEKWIFLFSISQKLIEKIKRKKHPKKYIPNEGWQQISFFGWQVCPLWRAKEVNIKGRLTKNFRLFRWLVCPLQCAKVSSAIFSGVRTLVVWPEHSVLDWPWCIHCIGCEAVRWGERWKLTY